MDDAVGRADVGGGEPGAVDADRAVSESDGHALVGEGFRRTLLDGGGEADARRDDVELQEGDEPGLVLRLEQRFEGALGQFGEGFVGGREDGERALALKRADEIGGLERGGEGFERAGGDGGVDEIGAGGGGSGGGGEVRERPEEEARAQRAEGTEVHVGSESAGLMWLKNQRPPGDFEIWYV